MTTTMRRPIAPPEPAPSRAAQRKQRLIELENEQRIEDAEALKMTEEQRLLLFHSFRSVKFEWSDLDGMRSVRRRYNSPTPTQTQTQSPPPPPPAPIHTQPPPLYAHQPYTYAYPQQQQHPQQQQQQPQFAVLTNARLASFGKDETIRGGSVSAYCSPHNSPSPHPPSNHNSNSATSTPAPTEQKQKPRLSGWSAPLDGQGQTAFPRRHPLAPSPTSAVSAQGGEKFLYPPGIALSSPVGVRTTTTTTTTTRKTSAGAKKDYREREGTRRGGNTKNKTKTRSPVKGLFALPPAHPAHPHPAHPAHPAPPATPAAGAGSPPIRVPLPPLLASIEVRVRGDEDEEDEDGWVDDDDDADEGEEEGEEEDELRTPVLRSGFSGPWGEAPPAYRAGHDMRDDMRDGYGEDGEEEETPETPRPWTPAPVPGERVYSYSQAQARGCEAQQGQGEDEQVGGKRKR